MRVDDVGDGVLDIPREQTTQIIRRKCKNE